MRWMLLLCAGITTTAWAGDAGPRLVHDGVVSTEEGSEIRYAVHPDGALVAWGSTDREGGAGGLDIWLMQRDADGWSAPRPAPFNAPEEDFDPAFSPDGERLYFHSARAGGEGGTDIYVVERQGDGWSPPRNLGAAVNSSGDEWAPTPLPDGTLLFASDGWGGFGRHDLFVVDPQRDARPRNLGGAINGPHEDFDAALLHGGDTLVFASGDLTPGASRVSLYRSARRADGGWSPRAAAGVGCGRVSLGLSTDPHDDGLLYVSAACDRGRERFDIWAVRVAPAPSDP